MKNFSLPGGFLLGLLWGMLLSVLPAQATHLLGGELTFHADTTNTSSLCYFFKLVLYQDQQNTAADSPTATLNFGDGTTATEARTSKTTLAANNTITRNVFYFQHDFPASGTFVVFFKDVNRSSGFLNIINSASISFFIQATVTIGLQAAGNHSPVFLAPFITSGTARQPFRHNVTAYDRDGDSLAYKLVPPLQNVNQTIISYQFPAGITMNHRTGEIIWPEPDKVGRYALAVEIREYRQRQLIGKVIRDFLVTILPTGEAPVLQIVNRNQVPVNGLNQVFITNLDAPVKIRVAATNASALDAYSGLFRHNNIITTQITADSPLEKEYTITPTAALRRNWPYIITFRGTSTAAAAMGVLPQQDLTVVIYFRPERATDQEDTTEPGEKVNPTGNPEPDGEVAPWTFNIYPNPVGTYFKVDNNSKSLAKLLLYNASSQLVLAQVLARKQTYIKRRSQLKSGIYYYIILSDEEKVAHKGKLLFL